MKNVWDFNRTFAHDGARLLTRALFLVFSTRQETRAIYKPQIIKTRSKPTAL